MLPRMFHITHVSETRHIITLYYGKNTLKMRFGRRTKAKRKGVLASPVFGLLVVVVFTLNRSFYPTTSAAHPVPVMILHPSETQIL